MILISDRFGTVTVASQVRRYDREVLGQHGGDQMPHRMGLRIAVREQYGRSIAPVDQLYLGAGDLYSLTLEVVEHALIRRTFRRPCRSLRGRSWSPRSPPRGRRSR